MNWNLLIDRIRDEDRLLFILIHQYLSADRSPWWAWALITLDALNWAVGCVLEVHARDDGRFQVFEDGVLVSMQEVLDGRDVLSPYVLYMGELKLGGEICE